MAVGIPADILTETIVTLGEYMHYGYSLKVMLKKQAISNFDSQAPCVNVRKDEKNEFR